MEQQTLKFVKKRALIIVPLFLLLSLVLSYLFAPLINLRCEAYERECSSSIVAKLESLQSKGYIQTKNAVANYLAQSPLIETYRIRGEFPFVLVVSIVEREPLAILRSQITEENIYVDTEGLLYMKGEISDRIPVLTLPIELPQIGTTIDQDLKSALDIVNRIAKEKETATSFMYTPRGIETTIDGKNYVFPITHDLDRLIGMFLIVQNQLNTLASNSTMKDITTSSEVDLRFVNAILR